MLTQLEPVAAAKHSMSLPDFRPITLRINGVEKQLDLAPWTTLLDALREYCNLTGTKKGCDHGQCGSCTVLVEGKRINACLALAVVQEGRAYSQPAHGPQPDHRWHGMGHRSRLAGRERHGPSLRTLHEP